MAVPILRTTSITTREAIIPYTMVGVNMLAAILAARGLLSPQALLAAVGLVIVGVPVSILLRRRAYNRILLNVFLMLPLLALTWMLIRDLPGLAIDWSEPWESLMSHDTADNLIVLLHALAVISAGRALSLVTPRDLLQTPIPSVSIFLLSAIIHNSRESRAQDPLVFVCLLALAASSLYLISQSHSQLWFHAQTPVRVQRQLVMWVLAISLLVFPLVLLIGTSLRSFSLLSMARYHSTRQYPSLRLPSFHGGRYGIGYSETIDTGGSRWPTGNQEIMQVQVRLGQTFLWRSTSYDRYVDGAWRAVYNRQAQNMRLEHTLGTGNTAQVDLSSPHCDPGIRQGLLEKQFSLDPKDPRYSLIDQIFTVSAPSIGRDTPVYGVFQIYRFRAENQPTALVSLDIDGGLNVNSRSVDGRLRHYEVTSIIKPPLNVLRLTTSVHLNEEAQSAYTQIPPVLRPEFRKLAEEILREAGLTPQSDPVRIVRQFEAYLGKNYLYTLKPSRPKGNGDPILDFLMTQKKGYCNYFSGAMVMLCRSVDLPARFVVGFATGEEMTHGASPGLITYKVSAKDAHSWVEIFLPRYGWYTSDPTAGSTEAPDLWGNTWDALAEVMTSMKEWVVGAVTALRQHPRLRAYLYLGLALLLILGAVFLLWRRERPPVFPQHDLSPAEARELLLSCYRRMHRWLKRWGVTKPRHLTAMEFEGYFRDLNPAMGETVAALTTLYIRAQYGAEPITDADARRAVTLLHTLWEQWREGHARFQATPAEIE